MATPPLPTTPLMQQAQQTMNNPMGAPVNPGGGIDPSVHPIVGQIVRALQAAATGYGWSAMSPQERENRTALQQQKAEALGRQAIAQQQLGLEAQRTQSQTALQSAEAERAREQTKTIGPQSAAQIAREQAETTRAQVEAGEAPKLTAIRQQQATTEQQKATSDIAHQRAEEDFERSGLAQKSKALDEEVRSHRAEEALGGRRADIAQQDADNLKARIDMESKHYDDQIQMQGKQLTREVLMQKIQNEKTTVDEYYKAHPWLAFLQGTDGINKQKDAIDAKYAPQLAQGVSVGAAGGGGGQPQGGGTAPTPGSHQFSRRAYSAANPKGDVEGASRSAAAAGYQVTD